MRFASIAVLLLLTAGCDRENAGASPAEPSRVAGRPGADQPAAKGAPGATPPSEMAPAAAPEPSSAEATPQPIAQPEAALTPRPRPPETTALSAAAALPRGTPASAPAEAATPTATAEPSAKPAPQAAQQPAAAAASVVHAPTAPSPPTSAAPIAPVPPVPSVAPVAPIAALAATLAEPPAAAAELDLKALQDQLRQTKAIGFMTKLTLKGQVDDLLSRFDDHYRGKTKETMKDLRRAYDLLMMKVLSLLQDTDQQLASAIVASREAIWGLLADPVKFETLQG